MFRRQTGFAVLGSILLVALIGCSSAPEASEPEISIGPCNGPLSDGCLDEDWEPMEVVGVQYALSDTLDEGFGALRLVLSYDSTADAFTGTVENITENTRASVGVVVYLDSRESWLDSEPLGDLAPGQEIEVALPVDGRRFTTWSAEVNHSPLGIARGLGLVGIAPGIRFKLDYDSTANAFTGIVENTTDRTLATVTVEVRLYNDSSDYRSSQVTLVDLAPGEVSEVTLPVGSDPFTAWTADFTTH